MTLTSAVRIVLRDNPETRLPGNQNIVYAKVCQVMGATEPREWPNPGSVSRIWHRNQDFARNLGRPAT